MVPDYDGYNYLKIAKKMTEGGMAKEAVNWTPLFPALVALFSFIPLPLDQIGSYINITCGSLTVIPIYLIVKRIFRSKEAGVFSVIPYTFHPQIAFVNVLVMSETTYIFMFFLLALFILKFLDGGNPIKYGIITGITAGLVYLGRSEGTLIFLLLSLFSLFFSSHSMRDKILWVIINIACFILTILPYLLFLRSQVGYFIFAGKSVEVLPQLRIMLNVPDDVQGYLGIFKYDPYKTYLHIKNNFLNLIRIISFGNFYLFLTLCALTISFGSAISKSSFKFLKGLAFFASLLSSAVAPLLFNVDIRYAVPANSVLSVMAGIGIYGVSLILSYFFKSKIVKIVWFLLIFFITAFWGYYDNYYQFEKLGEFQEMLYQERMHKTTGLWLKENVDPHSTLISTSPNYLIAYYAGDLNYEDASKNLTENELAELVCKAPNRYLIITEKSVRKYYKNMQYLINPISNSFLSSKLANTLVPIYYDYDTPLVVYKCKEFR